jgi:uncharacterized protein (TIGR03083 family)
MSATTETPLVEQLLAALRQSHDRLATAVADLAGADVERSSYHSWSIAQVLSHLGSGADIYTLVLEAGLSGTPAPGAEEDKPIWDRWDARSPEEQVREAVIADAAFLDRLAEVVDADDGSWRLDLFGTERDLAGVARLRLGEHVLHTWDVLAGLDPSAELAADAAALIVDGLGQMVAWVGRMPDDTAVRVETTDPSRVFLLSGSFDGSRLDVAAADNDLDLPVLRLPVAAFVRLVYGRLDPDHTPASVVADGVDLDDLRKAFPGV